VFPLIALLTALQSPDPPAAPARGAPSGVIACDSHGLPVGFSLVCALVVRDTNGALTRVPITATWASSNEKLATVSPNGLVRSVGGTGAVTIAATAFVNGQAIAANRVIAIAPNAVASRLSPSIVAPGSSRLRVGDRVLLDCSAHDDGGKEPPVYATTWRTGSSDIAVVSPMGVVTGIAPGTAAITCSSFPASAAITITVVR
jgi:hypothetical protein